MNQIARLRFLTLWLAASTLLGSAYAGDPVLTLPCPGSVTSNNMPSLAWTKADADAIEIWLDGRLAATLPGYFTRFVPFPLSFGQHRWQVVTRKGAEVTKSQPAGFFVEDEPLAALPPDAVLLREHWLVQSAEVAGTNGALLSSAAADTDTWAATSVPATVLTALVRNGIYPNPYVGLNNLLIPDADDRFNAKNDLAKYSHLPGRNPWRQPYWYRTTFRLPAQDAGKRIWLTFNEINYRAEVWLNGKRIAEPANMVGMARRFRFDVTAAVAPQSDNYLAVAIYPLDQPAEPAPPPITPLADPGRNMGADAGISVNYCKWDTIGWDWQPEVHDRDEGITEDVFVSATDDVEVQDLYVASEFDPAHPEQAELKLAFQVANYAATADPGEIKVSVRTPAGKTTVFRTAFDGRSARQVMTAAEHSELRIAHPELWWPAGEGAQPLYTVTVEARTSGGMAGRAKAVCGIRKVVTGMEARTHSRYFEINGRRVFVKGGNWVTDMMLNWTASRYGDEIALAKQANLNYLRVWGPTGVPPDAFFDAADRAGIMLQQDFLNDNWGTEHSAPGNYPPEPLVAEASSDIIKKCRNHPSVVLWCGGNEGRNPREALIRDRLLPALDPWGDRHYLPGSCEDGLQGGGPYDNVAPEQYFHNPKLVGFNSEVGPSGFPEWESLQQFLTLPPTNWAPGRFPLDGQCAYHDAADRPEKYEQRKFSHLDTLVRTRYGAPTGTDLAAVREYAERAQMLNYDTYRAVTESLNQGLWSQTTGFAFWKFNSSWPSLVWQLDDWYLQCHAGFYATRRGCAAIHVQFNSGDRSVAVVNRMPGGAGEFSVKAALYDSAVKPVWSRQEKVDAEANSVAFGSFTVPPREGLNFLKLWLTNRRGEPVADNFYWLNATNDFRPLAQWAPAHLRIKAELPRHVGGVTQATLTNDGAAPALLVRVKLIDLDSQAEILPSFWDDNYVNLLPGETVKLAARLSRSANWPLHPALSVSGYNLKEEIHSK